MSSKEMQELMAAQIRAIQEAYEVASPLISINDFAESWVAVNAQVFRDSYAIERA